jgi:hypothetical protein
VFKEHSIRGHSVQQGRLGPGRGVLTPRESECKGRWWQERWEGGGRGEYRKYKRFVELSSPHAA